MKSRFFQKVIFFQDVRAQTRRQINKKEPRIDGLNRFNETDSPKALFFLMNM